MRIAAFSRPHPSETANGDLWLSIPHKNGWRITIIDGAGHGPAAAKAAGVAEAIFRSSEGRNLSEVLRCCHDELRGTRGAVMSIAEIVDNQLTFVGVGNVDGLLVDSTGAKRLLPDRGMLGAALPSARPFTTNLTEPWVFVMHSDGVSDKFGANLMVNGIIASPEAFARDTVDAWGRNSDDATLVVIHY